MSQKETPLNQYSENIRTAIIAARAASGITQKEVADFLYRSQSWYSKFENGLNSLRAEEFLYIKKKLGLHDNFVKWGCFESSKKTQLKTGSFSKTRPLCTSRYLYPIIGLLRKLESNNFDKILTKNRLSKEHIFYLDCGLNFQELKTILAIAISYGEEFFGHLKFHLSSGDYLPFYLGKAKKLKDSSFQEILNDYLERKNNYEILFSIQEASTEPLRLSTILVEEIDRQLSFAEKDFLLRYHGLFLQEQFKQKFFDNDSFKVTPGTHDSSLLAVYSQ